jgi:hypothetical protein
MRGAHGRSGCRRCTSSRKLHPCLVHHRFSELDCGITGGRALTLQGGTLLHVAAEYSNLTAVGLLLDRGADVNARATVDEAGVGGYAAIFHSVTQFDDGGLPVTHLLVERGADLAVRVKVPGDYDRPGEIVECTAGVDCEVWWSHELSLTTTADRSTLGPRHIWAAEPARPRRSRVDWRPRL